MHQRKQIKLNKGNTKKGKKEEQFITIKTCIQEQTLIGEIINKHANDKELVVVVSAINC